MKFFAPIFASIAMLAAQVAANGVCYDPNHSASGTMDAESVKADLATIKNHGFTAVRTYISEFGGTNLGQLIGEFGMFVALGVPYPLPNYEAQLQAALSAVITGKVSYIFFGNENLAGETKVPPEMIEGIKSIKAIVPSTVKVGTVQRNTEVINYAGIAGWSDLVDACDVIGVNVHPYFTPGTTPDNAIDVVKAQWAIMQKNFGDKLLLTETGWPSDGTLMGNYGSTYGTKKFYSDYQAWSSSLPESFYFQMFDTPYKTTPFEKSFGLCTSDSNEKFSLALALSVSNVGTVGPQRLRQ